MRARSVRLGTRGSSVVSLSLAVATLAVATSGCAAATETGIRLEVRYDDTWSLSELELVSGDLLTRAPVAHEVLIRLSEERAASPLELEVAGLRGNLRYAVGRTTVEPEPGVIVRATIELRPLPCGTLCVVGSRRCSGDAVVLCEQDEGEECPEWGAPVQCSPDAPSCSLGECRDGCVDECASGDRECAGAGEWRMCGQADSDACLDWLTPTPCASGEVCSLGRCGSECVDECTEGSVWCSGAGVVRCADRDRDGCLERGAPEPCPSGESCQGGACRPIESCEDECTASVCEGLTYRACGNYDLDPCLEPSPGTSCARGDGCEEGHCTASGCETTTTRCDTPPASTCLDADTMLVYDASGTCGAGGCTYRSREQTCPRCPACDACAGVTCTTPPNGCYAETGTCTDGACTYSYRDGGACDDGDSCTDGDSCRSGTCAGTARACTTPPSACHAATGSCSAGSCSYAFRDGARCDDGNPATHDDVCAAGTCAGRIDDPTWVEIAVGGEHACARDESGSVVCWGANGAGELGDGTTTGRSTPGPVSGITDAVELAAGDGHTCARRASGTIACWGSNGAGELGDGTTTARSTPVEVSGITGAVEVSAGGDHTCARLSSGEVRCWGSNSDGQLGDGSTTSRSSAAAVGGLGDAVEIAAGGRHTCARRASGEVWCWGSSSEGQIGDGSTDRRLSPTAASGLSDAVEIGAGDLHTCARRSGGAVACWGDNRRGQIGDGSMGNRRSPRAVRDLFDAAELTVGGAHTCIRRTSGAVACWGVNSSGQLGNGATGDENRATAVSGVGDAVGISAGGATSCAMRASGAVVCWGMNGSGQIGDGTTTNRTTATPVMLP